MTDDERIAEMWPHIDGWPDPPALATATRAEVEEYAGIRLAAQAMVAAEADMPAAVSRFTPEQTWVWAQRTWATLGKRNEA